jgi:hypothetical protein
MTTGEAQGLFILIMLENHNCVHKKSHKGTNSFSLASKRGIDGWSTLDRSSPAFEVADSVKPGVSLAP